MIDMPKTAPTKFPFWALPVFFSGVVFSVHRKIILPTNRIMHTYWKYMSDNLVPHNIFRFISKKIISLATASINWFWNCLRGNARTDVQLFRQQNLKKKTEKFAPARLPDWSLPRQFAPYMSREAGDPGGIFQHTWIIDTTPLCSMRNTVHLQTVDFPLSC